MKIFCPVLIVTAGISFANAGEIPKEGTYDYVACWSGTVSEMKLPGGDIARLVEFTGSIRAKDPSSIFNNNSFRCVSVGATSPEKKNAGITAGKLGGTGKFDGMVTLNQTIEELGPIPTIQPGTLQSCNHQTGTYKLK